MSTIRKVNVSEVQGYNPDVVLPSGTLVLFNDNGTWKLRLHDGVTTGGNTVGELGTISSLQFADDSVQTTAFLGLTDTLDSITDRGATTTNIVNVGGVTTANINSGEIPATGARVTDVPPPEGAGVPWQYTWVGYQSDVQALIALGDLTGYIVEQSNHPANTVTVLGMVNLGGSLGISVSDQLFFDGGNTLTFTAPDYAPASSANLTVSAGTNNWVFSANSTLTFPNDVRITLGGAMDMNSINFSVPASINPSNRYEWAFDASYGFPLLRFPDNSLQSTAWSGGRVVEEPLASTGAEGDQERDLAFSNGYIYYCTADYTDGLSNIWKRIAWSGDTW